MRNPRILPVLAVLLSAAGLIGCDPVYGVDRYAPVSRMPDPAQVLAAVRSTPGVDSVVDVIARDPWNRRAGDTATSIVLEYYGRGDVDGLVQFHREGGQVAYGNGVERMGVRPPQRQVDATYPVMLVVEARLETLPGLAGLRRTAVEQCVGVRCPSAPPGP